MIGDAIKYVSTEQHKPFRESCNHGWVNNFMNYPNWNSNQNNSNEAYEEDSADKVD